MKLSRKRLIAGISLIAVLFGAAFAWQWTATRSRLRTQEMLVALLDSLENFSELHRGLPANLRTPEPSTSACQINSWRFVLVPYIDSGIPDPSKSWCDPINSEIVSGVAPIFCYDGRLRPTIVMVGDSKAISDDAGDLPRVKSVPRHAVRYVECYRVNTPWAAAQDFEESWLTDGPTMETALQLPRGANSPFALIFSDLTCWECSAELPTSVFRRAIATNCPLATAKKSIEQFRVRVIR